MVCPAGFAEALGERHLEVRVLGGHAEVRQQPEIDAAAHAVAVDLRDGRLGEFPQIQRRPQEQVGRALVEVLEGVAEVRIGVFVGAPTRNVPAAEALAVRLEDDDLDLLVAVGLVQAVVDFGDQDHVLGVGLVDPVQDDPGDRRFALIDDRLADAPLHRCDTTEIPHIRRAENGA
jgi:hypothetical protein